MTNHTEISKIQAELRTLDARYRALQDQLNGGNDLLQYVSPETKLIVTRGNYLIDKLKELNPRCPKNLRFLT